MEVEIKNKKNFISYQILFLNYMEFHLRLVYQSCEKLFDENVFTIYLLVESCGETDGFQDIGSYIHTYTCSDNADLIGKELFLQVQD